MADDLFWLRYALRSSADLGAWERGIQRSHASVEVLSAYFRHQKVRESLIVEIADIAVPELVQRGRRELAGVEREIGQLVGARQIQAADGAAMTADVRQTAEHVAALERRAARGPLVAAKGVLALQHRVQQATRTGFGVTLRTVAERVDPRIYRGLTDVFEQGPLGERAWDHIAAAFQRVYHPGAEQPWIKNVLASDVQEVLGFSHPGYRSVIAAKSELLRRAGMRPVEVFADSHLSRDGGQLLLFRDGMLLGEITPPKGSTVGLAAIAVTNEARPAVTKGEAAMSAAEWLDNAEYSRQRLASALDQQITSLRREGDALVKPGAVLVTPDGRAYELVPLPDRYRAHVMARPFPVSGAGQSELAERARRILDPFAADEYLATRREVVTPYASEQLSGFCWGILRGMSGGRP